jgi:hypothetical protein
MEKETIEEAALRNCEIITHPYYIIEKKLMFIEGVKWQAERMYSEEEPDYDKIKEALVEIRKIPMTFSPDERMYSESDKIMKFLNTEKELKLSDAKTIERIKWYFETYFEQFKKK